MKEDVDVSSGDPERGGHVFAVALFEHSQGDDGALRVAQALDARAQADVLLGAGDLLVGRWTRGGVLLGDRLVGTRHVVEAALVARGVSHDSSQVRARLARGVAGEDDAEIRAECILHAVDRVFGAEALAARDRDQARSLRSRGMGKKVEDVFFHRSS